jgi:hypothetical protein
MLVTMNGIPLRKVGFHKISTSSGSTSSNHAQGQHRYSFIVNHISLLCAILLVGHHDIVFYSIQHTLLFLLLQERYRVWFWLYQAEFIEFRHGRFKRLFGNAGKLV